MLPGCLDLGCIIPVKTAMVVVSLQSGSKVNVVQEVPLQCIAMYKADRRIVPLQSGGTARGVPLQSGGRAGEYRAH